MNIYHKRRIGEALIVNALMVSGATGKVIMDDQMDREPDYWFWFFGPGYEEMTPWMEMSLSRPQSEV